MKNLFSKIVLAVGIFSMIVSVYGTFLSPGAIEQKICFLVGAFGLTVTAFLNRHKMYSSLQSIVVIGAVLSFFPFIKNEWKYIFMIIPSVVAVLYLLKVKYFSTDKWGVLACVGLLALALGFATDGVEFPVLLNTFLLFAGLVLAIYSAIQVFYYKIKIAWLWLILNAIFAINPAIFLFLGRA